MNGELYNPNPGDTVHIVYEPGGSSTQRLAREFILAIQQGNATIEQLTETTLKSQDATNVFEKYLQQFQDKITIYAQAIEPEFPGLKQEYRFFETRAIEETLKKDHKLLVEIPARISLDSFVEQVSQKIFAYEHKLPSDSNIEQIGICKRYPSIVVAELDALDKLSKANQSKPYDEYMAQLTELSKVAEENYKFGIWIKKTSLVPSMPEDNTLEFL